MVKRFLLLTLLCSMAAIGLACDVCGAGAASQNMGLMPFYHKNYVRLSWSHAPFTTLNPYGADTKDNFHTCQLTMRYHFTERWKVNLSQPFSNNLRLSDEGKQSLNGLGDLRVNLFYTLFNKKRVSKKYALSSEIGLGGKAPTGEYDPKIHDQNLPENFNPGTGNWSGSAQMNWVLQSEKYGLATSASMLFNGKSSDGYQYGDQIASNLIAFAKFNIKKKWFLTPHAGVYNEYIEQDRYANDLAVNGTGGNGSFMQVGFNAGKGKWMVSSAYFVPIAQSYSEEEVVSKPRFSIDLNYFFK